MLTTTFARTERSTFIVLLRWELPLLSLLVGFICCRGLLAIPLHPDESQWIATSSAFEDFVHPTSSHWHESYFVLTQLPITRYIIGLGRRVGGYRATDLNAPWPFLPTLAANIAAGAMPSPGLLWWSRLPMALLTACCALLLFVLLRRTAGRLAAYLLLVLLLANPFLMGTLRRAMAEAPLLAAQLVVAYASVRALELWQREHPAIDRNSIEVLAWCMLAGVGGGVAAGIKLNGLVSILGSLLVCVLAFHPSSVRVVQCQVALLMSAAALLLGVAALIFVVSNPYLYPDVLRRTGTLITWRLQETQQTQAELPDQVFHDLQQRLLVTFQYLFVSRSTLRTWVLAPVNLVAAASGILFLFRTMWRSVSRAAGPGANGVLLITAISSAGPMLLTPLTWDRYFFLPIIWTTVAISIGLAYGVEQLPVILDKLGPILKRNPKAR